MKLSGFVSSALCVSLLPLCSAVAGASESVKLLNAPAYYGAPQEICPALRKMLIAFRRPQRKKIDCHWRLDAIPKGFPDFALPDWQPWPKEKVTQAAVEQIWRSSYLQEHFYNPGKSIQSLIVRDGVLRHIQRAIEKGQFEISEASIDVDVNGTRERVLRLDSQDCDVFAGAQAHIPEYPRFAVLRPDGLLDESRSFPNGAWASDLIVFKGKIYPILFEAAVGWIKDAAPGHGVMSIDVEQIIRARHPIEIGSTFQEMEICVLRMDKEK